MLTGSFSLSVSALGVTTSGGADRTGELGIEPVNANLSVGYAGILTTRTDDDTGVVTLSEGHDVTTGKVDIHWDTGCRYNMDGVATVNSLAIDGGDGDNLPDEDTAVVAQNPKSFDVTFDGDNLSLIGVSSNRQAMILFLDSEGAVVGDGNIFLIAGASWGWASNMGGTNPLTGNAVAEVVVSNGNATYTNNFKLTGLQYAE